MKATIVAFLATFSPIFDVPVFWPILVRKICTPALSSHIADCEAIFFLEGGWRLVFLPRRYFRTKSLLVRSPKHPPAMRFFFVSVQVLYFIVLFVATMRRQFMDMKRFKYVPWDIGRKKKYTSNVSVTTEKR